MQNLFKTILFLLIFLSQTGWAQDSFWKFGSKNRCENLLSGKPQHTLSQLILYATEDWANAKFEWGFHFLKSFAKVNQEQLHVRSAEFANAVEKLRLKTYRTVGQSQNIPSVFFMSRQRPPQIATLPGIFPDPTHLSFDIENLYNSRLREDQGLVLVSSKDSVNPFDDLSFLEKPDMVVSTKQYQLMNTNYNKNLSEYRINAVSGWGWSSIEMNRPLQWKINEGLDFLPTRAVWVYYQYEFADVTGVPLNFGDGDSHGVIAPFIDFAKHPPLRFRKVVVMVKIPYLSGHESSVLEQTYQFDHNGFYNPSNLVNYTELVYSDWQELPK